MSDFIQVADAFYVRASSNRVDDRTHVLKCDDAFAVFDRRGDVHPHGRGQQGLYYRGTRFLSRFEITLGGSPPLLLSSATKVDSAELVVDSTNVDLARDGVVWLAANLVHVCRSTLLTEDACHQRFVVHNYAPHPVDIALTLHHDADFRDVFEVRGSVRARRGELLAPRVGDGHVVLRYRGLDDLVRAVSIECTPRPQRSTAAATTFHCHLEAQGECVLQVVCRCGFGDDFGARPAPRDTDYDAALARQRERTETLRNGSARFSTSDAACNAWLERSESDLRMMLAATSDGWFPHAGVPWYSTVFGRDGLLTAFECLLIDPRIARGVLGHLAALQATTTDEARDAQPGKILHELRDGEMAALGEIPFGRYYGSVDATPLFVLLAGHYWRRTGDLAFVRRLWPAIEAALAWCDHNTTDGFVSYQRYTPVGLANQGWKDSHDAVFHADGTLANEPIALCEVQAYVYGARLLAADVADALGNAPRAVELRAAAAALQIAFERRFWCEELGTYALALDGDGRPCRVRTSNPGHCLLTGLATPERAARVVAGLLAPDSWTGFGIRTAAAGQRRYNPLAYHNGSVWPHDNALIAFGMARYGFRDEAQQVLGAMRHASELLDLRRLPELFCGLPRRPDEGPTLYPVACAPQAWAIGASFLLLQSCLGIDVDGVRGEVVVTRPSLPDWLDQVTIANLPVGAGHLDLQFRHRPARRGGAEVIALRGDAPLVVRE